MTELTLGASPKLITVTLVPRADFICALDAKAADGTPDPWPAGAVIALAFDDPDETVWPATITDATAAWNVDKAAVDTLIAALPPGTPGVRLTYTEGSTDLVWGIGYVTVRR